jgi:hypothetical protein
MALCGHTFHVDAERGGASTWEDVLYFCSEGKSYSNSGNLLLFQNKTDKILKLSLCLSDEGVDV